MVHDLAVDLGHTVETPRISRAISEGVSRCEPPSVFAFDVEEYLVDGAPGEADQIVQILLSAFYQELAIPTCDDDRAERKSGNRELSHLGCSPTELEIDRVRWHMSTMSDSRLRGIPRIRATEMAISGRRCVGWGIPNGLQASGFRPTTRLRRRCGPPPRRAVHHGRRSVRRAACTLLLLPTAAGPHSPTAADNQDPVTLIPRS